MSRTWRTIRSTDKLAAEQERIAARIDQASEEQDRALAKADEEVSKLSEKAGALARRIDAMEDGCSDVEYLELRAVEADRDLAAAQVNLAAAERDLALEDLRTELAEVTHRLFDVDVGANWHAPTAGNDMQSAILMLNVQEAALDRSVATTNLDYSRRRLELTERMHREIHGALDELRAKESSTQESSDA